MIVRTAFAITFVMFAVAQAHATDTTMPTCDGFRTRLESANRILELRSIKPIRPIREPQEGNGDDLWIVYDDEGDEIMDVTCKTGSFVSLEFIEPGGLVSIHPDFDYIAAGIFGFTGWPADKVIKTATDIWKTKEHMRPESERGDNSYKVIDLPGLCASISFSEFSIGSGCSPRH